MTNNRISLTSILILAITLGSTCTNAVALVPRSQSQSGSLSMLNPITSASELTCRASLDTISCYGGKTATAATCRSACSCDISNTVTCRAYSNCDDSSMDHFCAGFCLCSHRSDPLRGGEGGKIKKKKHRHTKAKDFEDLGISLQRQA